MQRRITITSEGNQLIEDAIDASNKILAIKACRKHGRIYPADENRNDPNSVGLREAKHAIEVKYFDGNASEATALLGPSFIVKKLVIEVPGEGEVEVDLEGLQLRFLQELEALGLQQIQHLLELTEYIRSWQG